MNVFLNAEDCAIIAPYIEIPKDWEWWYAPKEDLMLCHRSCPGTLYSLETSDSYKFNGRHLPAIDTQLLGEALIKDRPNLRITSIDGRITIDKVKGERWMLIKELSVESELENRRDAMMYLIENKLIEEIN